MTRHPRPRAFSVLTLFAATVLAAQCSRTAPPASPTATPSVDALVVSGSRELIEGETVSLVATARLSDGTTSVVTDRATWTSQDPAVATVNDRGVVTALRSGEARISAAFQSVSGSASFAVRPRVRDVIGRVHESFPTAGTNIAGATVAAVDVNGNTSTAQTDAAGRFTLRLSGVATFTVSAPGYETRTLSSADASASELDVPLRPVQREVQVTFPYIYPLVRDFPLQRSYRIHVHHAGELRAAYTSSWVGASAQALTNIEVRDAAGQLLTHVKGAYDQTARSVRLQVMPGTYEVKFYVCCPTVATDQLNIGGWGGEVRHPS